MTLSLHSLFEEMALLLLAAMAAGVLAVRLRQPLIIAFIIVGIISGPVGFNIIRSTEQLTFLAEMGLSLLLFVVGLKLDPQLIRRMGTVSLATGLGQMTFTGLIGFTILRLIGMPLVTSIYVAGALTLSSTILIVKLLSDKRDTDSLYGRISIGFLIVDDIVVIMAMIALSGFSGTLTVSPAMQALLIILKGTGLFLSVWALNKFIFPKFLPVVSRSIELLLLFGITWAVALAAASELLGFNKEVGAFIAGLSLASTMYRDLLTTKLASLRDFLLLFYFLELGSRLDLHAVGSQISIAIILSLLVLIGKPFIVMFILGKMGYRKRTGFMAGLTVAQISEFSLILAAMGVEVGHLDQNALGLITMVLMITMGIDVHLITHAQSLYDRARNYLNIFERKNSFQEDDSIKDLIDIGDDCVILIGLGRYGSKIFAQLTNRGRKTIGMDFDPETVKAWNAKGEKVVFGDAEDPDFAHLLPLSNARWVISSIRDNHLNNRIITALRNEGYKGLFACATEESPVPSSERLDENVDLLFDPFEDSAVQATDLIFTTEEEITKRAMEKLIDSMSDHYIICGYGRMGQQIVKDLTRYNIPCVVVEWNPEQLPKLREQNIPHIEGKASEDSILLKAGIQRAKGLIAVAPSDEENVFIVLTAKVLNPRLFIVARSILKGNEDKLKHAGADMVMSPYVLGGRRMAAAVIRPEVMDFLDLVVHTDGLETEMASITVPQDSRCIGKTLSTLNLWEKAEVTLLAVKRSGEDLHANPSPSFVIHENDELIVMGTPSQINAAKEQISSCD
ncbi:MAG TPA: cation:proton antiporter [Armatimonadota bacterium]|nr:cation:proton antiporter [Armatimonadota bacterium]